MTPVLEILMSKAWNNEDSHPPGGTLGSRLRLQLEMGLHVFLQSRQLLIPRPPLLWLLLTTYGF